MGKKFLLVSVLIASFLGGNATSQGLESEEELRAIERAHVSIEKLKSNFRKVLSEELASKGAAKALGACKIKAPKATSEVQGGEIIEVGRTSHKIRNPKNQPRQWLKPYLEKYATNSISEVPKHTIVKLGEHHFGYLEPIFVEPICLNCHGKQIENEVLKAILKEYPDDKATGFQTGEFRGLLWLEMKTSIK